MTSWKIRVTGDEDAERALRGFVATMLDLRPFWPLVVPMFIRWMREQFESEGAWGGSKWAPLTPAYAAYKATHFPGQSILIAHGKLRAAASSPERLATPSSLTLFILDPKAEFHQDGTPRMVKRQIIPDNLPAEADLDLHELADRYVAEAVARFGLS